MKNKIQEIKIDNNIEVRDNDRVYASCIVLDNNLMLIGRSSSCYYVLASSTELFNICDCLSDVNKKDNTKGGKEFILRSCSKNCYDFYVKYLKFKNKADLRIAQRSFSNGEK